MTTITLEGKEKDIFECLKRTGHSTLQDASEEIRATKSDTKCSGVSAGRGDL